MTFLDNVKNSIYGPEFYKKLLTKAPSFSFKYFYALVSVLAVVLTAQFSFRAIPSLNTFLAGIGPQIVSNYPNELVITIKNGQASSNVDEPYFIKTPASILGENFKNVPVITVNGLQPSSSSSSVPENLIVIDTKNQFSEADFDKYNTFAVLTKTSLAMRKDSGKIEIQSLNKIPDWTISKASVSSFVGKIQPFIKFASPLFVLMFFVGYMFYFSLQLIYLLLAALLIWAVTKIKKLQIGYKKSYQAGLHIMTFPLLIGAISTILNIHITDAIPFFTTIVIVVFATINFEPRKTESVVS